MKKNSNIFLSIGDNSSDIALTGLWNRPRGARAAARPFSLFRFMEEVIGELVQSGRVRTGETYASTLRSFRRFRHGRDLLPAALTAAEVQSYEAYLRQQGLTPNTTSFYLRILRAVYHRAVGEVPAGPSCPFRHVYTGVERTVKRAVPAAVIRRIRGLSLCGHPALALARDMFLFSFYTRGMSFVDMAFLRKSDLHGDVLCYRRRKTGQQLFIHWEPAMQEIVDRNPSAAPFLLPLIRRPGAEERRQYLYAAHNVNRALRIIGRQLGLSAPLTMYVARHSWASIARSRAVPLSVISEALGHESEATTRIYLAALSSTAVDRANRGILRSLQ